MYHIIEISQALFYNPIVHKNMFIRAGALKFIYSSFGNLRSYQMVSTQLLIQLDQAICCEQSTMDDKPYAALQRTRMPLPARLLIHFVRVQDAPLSFSLRRAASLDWTKVHQFQAYRSFALRSGDSFHFGIVSVGDGRKRCFPVLLAVER